MDTQTKIKKLIRMKKAAYAATNHFRHLQLMDRVFRAENELINIADSIRDNELAEELVAAVTF